MITDEKFWANIVANANIEDMWEYIKGQYDVEITSCHFYDDCGLGIMTWMYDTHCCSLSLDEPPHWFTIKMIRAYIDKKFSDNVLRT